VVLLVETKLGYRPETSAPPEENLIERLGTRFMAVEEISGWTELAAEEK
jgi:hypothetical protein